MIEAIGGLLGLAVLGIFLIIGYLLLSGNAVLYSEQPDVRSGYGFDCKYFTGTRTIEAWNGTTTGCLRIIPVGR